MGPGAIKNFGIFWAGPPTIEVILYMFAVGTNFFDRV